jgi:cytochrome c556
MFDIRRIVPANRTPAAIGIALGLIVAGSAAAQSPNPVAGDPAAQVKHREESMKKMGGAMKAISQYVKNEGGTIDAVRTSAATIQNVSKTIVPELFPKGTEIGVADSEAKPDIWQQWPRFQEIAGNLQTESAKLAQVAQTDDRAQVAAQFGAVGKTCGSCHDTFRQEKKK